MSTRSSPDKVPNAAGDLKNSAEQVVPSYLVFSDGTTSISSWRCMVMGPVEGRRSSVISAKHH